MPKFRVGDIVIGRKDNGYNFTTDKATMRVVNVYEDKNKMEVKILAHKEAQLLNKVGQDFTVDMDGFIVCRPRQLINK